MRKLRLRAIKSLAPVYTEHGLHRLNSPPLLSIASQLPRTVLGLNVRLLVTCSVSSKCPLGGRCYQSGKTSGPRVGGGHGLGILEGLNKEGQRAEMAVQSLKGCLHFGTGAET